MIRSLVLLLLAGPAWARIQDLTRVPGASGSEVVEQVVSRISESSVFADDIRFLRRLAFIQTHDGRDSKTYRPGYDGGIWQIDSDQFNQIKKSSKATVLFEAVNSQFAIDWNTVQWSDLRKPLYSGLAAALYLSTIDEKAPQLKDVQNIHLEGDKLYLDDSSEKTFSLIFYPPDFPGVCSAGPPHFQPHPQDATKFLLCRHGEAFYMFQCIPQYVYKPSTHTCIPQPTSQRATEPAIVPTRGPTPANIHQTQPVPNLVPSTGKPYLLYPLMPSTSFPHDLHPQEATTPSTRPHVPHQYKDAVNPCKNAHENNMYYYANPTDRQKYIQCDPYGDAFERTCPDNKFWHQNLLTCILEGLHPAGTLIG